MKKLMIFLLAVLMIRCNDSASVQEPNDLDRTDKFDTNPARKIDSARMKPLGDSTDSTGKYHQ